MAVIINGSTGVDISAGNLTLPDDSTIASANGLGPSTDYGDVGTYIFGAKVQGRVAEGSTAAGSSIANLTLHGYSTTYMLYGTMLSPQGYFYASDYMSGTWRQMFDAGIGNSSTNARGGLWVRIS